MRRAEPLTPIQNLLCGFAGVAIPRTVVAPIDWIKLIATNNPGRVLPEVKSRLTNQGTLAMWNGIICDWIRLPPQFIIRYVVGKQLRQTRCPPGVADNIAAVIATTAIHPVEVVHTLMQTNRDKYPSIATTAAIIARTEGLAGFYKGLTPTILGYIPYRAVQYWSALFYERIVGRSGRSNLVSDGVASSLISGVAQFASYPFETVRKRMMSDPSLKGKSCFEIMKDTYSKRGIVGLYDSFGWSIARTLPLIWVQQFATRELRKVVATFNYTVKKHQL